MKTPDELAQAHREAQRRYREKNRARISAAEKIRRSTDEAKFKRFVYDEENRERRAACLKAWKVARGYKEPPRPKTNRAREYNKRWGRARYLRDFKDKAAQARRIVARVEAIVPKSLPDDARTAVVAAIIEAIYHGDILCHPTAQDVQPFIKAHFRDASDWRTVSLDDVLGDDGFTRGVAMGVY